MESGGVVASNVALDDVPERAIIIEATGMDCVGLHRVEEGFDECVVTELARAFHALRNSKRSQAGTEGMRRIFYAAVGMEDQACSNRTTPLSIVESIHCQLQDSSRSQTPTQNPSGVSVQDHRQIPPASSTLQIGHIPYPHLIGCRRPHPQHPVRNLREEPPCPGHPPIDPGRTSLQSGFPH